MKLLFLHGIGGSEMIASLMIPGLKAEFAQSEVHVLEGFIQLSDDEIRNSVGMDDNMKASGLKGTVKLHCWYQTETKGGLNWPLSYSHVESARDKIIDAIAELGGVDGIIGFSQGATMAFLIGEQRATLNKMCGRQLRFIAGFGAGPTALKLRGHDSPKGSMDGLLVYLCSGRNDPVGGADRLSEIAAKLQPSGATILMTEWSGGHKMPPTGDRSYSQLRAAAEARLPPLQRLCMALAACLCTPDNEAEPHSGGLPQRAAGKGNDLL